MTERATFSLDKEAYDFLTAMGGDNKSAYISDLLRKEKQRNLEEAIMQANLEEAEDLAYQEELVDWEVTLNDGLSTDD